MTLSHLLKRERLLITPHSPPPLPPPPPLSSPSISFAFLSSLFFLSALIFFFSFFAFSSFFGCCFFIPSLPLSLHTFFLICFTSFSFFMNYSFFTSLLFSSSLSLPSSLSLFIGNINPKLSKVSVLSKIRYMMTLETQSLSNLFMAYPHPKPCSGGWVEVNKIRIYLIHKCIICMITHWL